MTLHPLQSIYANYSVEGSDVLSLIAQYPEGLSLSAIMIFLPQIKSRRTLQRNLARAVAQGKLRTTGCKRSTRYCLPSIVISSVGQTSTEQTRIIPYNRNFLDAYIPNQSAYLSQEICDMLASIGKMAEGAYQGETQCSRMLHYFLIDLSFNSSRLEGNTYSLLETERLINTSQSSETKSVLETQMILNHKAAIEFLVRAPISLGFNRYTILNTHALLADNLLSNPSACGRLRNIPVGIVQTPYRPTHIPQLIEECFQIILDKAEAIKNPFEQAFFILIQLPYLQPFEDVNKRVSRLIANIPFIREGLCPLSFVGVSTEIYIDSLLSIYEKNQIDAFRDLFVDAYQQSTKCYGIRSEILGEPDVLRLKYRAEIAEIILRIIRNNLMKVDAAKYIKQFSRDHIPLSEQQHFIECVETELLCLHEGNIARYQISLEIFRAWNESWAKK